jgi:hypothetical protein
VVDGAGMVVTIKIVLKLCSNACIYNYLEFEKGTEICGKGF